MALARGQTHSAEGDDDVAAVESNTHGDETKQLRKHEPSKGISQILARKTRLQIVTVVEFHEDDDADQLQGGSKDGRLEDEPLYPAEILTKYGNFGIDRRVTHSVLSISGRK